MNGAQIIYADVIVRQNESSGNLVYPVHLRYGWCRTILAGLHFQYKYALTSLDDEIQFHTIGTFLIRIHKNVKKVKELKKFESTHAGGIWVFLRRSLRSNNATSRLSMKKPSFL